MYVPKSFAVEDRAVLVEFIKREPFGILVSSIVGKPFATHVPFIIETGGESLRLALHVAKANPQWQNIEGQDVLAIFNGPHAMVSAGWYADPEHTVPTWNYSAVHCSGTARLTDAAGTRRIIEKLVAQFEPAWRIDQAEPDYIEQMERAIVGIEIDVTRVDVKFKYSQNRTPEDRERVMNALASSSRPMDRQVSDEMRLLR
ncbi:MAG TPA: FMN-binding negative transcriptional regulator [Candidatus Baltobacteraceae bacterium]|nr:FMN-binding negative transcriptional regulator [Candidatus Baltobacteraceae bacterium]